MGVLIQEMIENHLKSLKCKINKEDGLGGFGMFLKNK